MDSCRGRLRLDKHERMSHMFNFGFCERSSLEAHFSQSRETKGDLIDILIAYFDQEPMKNELYADR